MKFVYAVQVPRYRNVPVEVGTGTRKEIEGYDEVFTE